MNSFYVFLYFIFPPVVLVFGLFGNILGFSLMKRPGMSSIGPRDTFKYLFVFDTIYLLQIIVNYLQFSLNIDPTILSSISCKVWFYMSYSVTTPSAMLLAYISIDGYVSLKIPARRFLLRKRNYQFIYCMIVLMWNLIYYMPTVYMSNIYTVNDTTICNYDSDYDQNLLSYMDLVNRVCLPSLIIMIFSFLLAIEVIKSKQRILANFKEEENRYYFKQIRLAISSIFLNITYIASQLPLSIVQFEPNYYLLDAYMLTYYLYYLSYAINFYVLLLFNSVFKSELTAFVNRLIMHVK